MSPARWLPAVLLLALTAPADELPQVEHQPSPCTVPDKPFRLCSRVTQQEQRQRGKEAHELLRCVEIAGAKHFIEQIPFHS